ncbi:MAG: hypothetical protein IIB69_11325 [Proteobacteria bacterium]|nr:hypothetical protein [Pseudomonadota bacterium]
MKSTLIIMSIMGALFLGNAFANEDSNSARLLERIQALEEHVAVLETHFSFASFMPDFAERFHVMHRASDVEDWAVAAHQLKVMKELMDSSTIIDSENGHLLQTMMGPVFEKIDTAIAHSNKEKMAALLGEAAQTCNNCHVATGSAFLKVTLDSNNAMSMRHPHVLTKQKMAAHAH